MEHFPLIPVEDEGRLHDCKLRENAIERIFTVTQWCEILSKEWRMGNLVEFHTHHKLLILSQSEKHYKSTGKLVGVGKDRREKTD